MRVAFIFLISFAINAQNLEHFRIYSNNKKNDLIFIREDGTKLTLPSGSRASKSYQSDHYYIYDNQSHEYIQAKLVYGENKTFKQTPIKAENLDTEINYCLDHANLKDVLINEIEEAIYQSQQRVLNLGDYHADLYNKNFQKQVDLINELKLKLRVLSTAPNFEDRLKNQVLKFKNKIDSQKLSDFEAIQYFDKIIEKTYSPIDVQSKSKKTYSQTTVFVPLSKTWFEGHPKLLDFYNKNSEELGRMEGHSGEGVQNWRNQPEMNYFNKSKKVLFALRDLILTIGVTQTLQTPLVPLKKDCEPQLSEFEKYLISTPETLWLSKLSEDYFKDKERIIYIQDLTLENHFSGPFNSYIPTDQSLGCFPSNNLLSVMIHELNVNSVDYMPDDTHAFTVENTEKNFQKAREKFNFSHMKSFTARESQIQLIYLKMILDL